jgi:hypothetical protein
MGARKTRFILRVLLLIPVVFFPLCRSSGQKTAWYERGVGWPLHYGWQATDLGPLAIPSISSVGSYFVDLCIGVSAAVLLWVVARYSLAKLYRRPNQALQPTAGRVDV